MNLKDMSTISQALVKKRLIRCKPKSAFQVDHVELKHFTSVNYFETASLFRKK